MVNAIVDKTNYSLLSIVAIVGIVAIFAMFIHARTTDALPTALPITLTPGDSGASAGLTGNVVADQPTTAVQDSFPARNIASDAAYDYNSDGALDQSDATILKQVVARERFCPTSKICDVNQDGLVNANDVSSYQAGLVARGVAKAAAAASVKQSSPSPVTVPTLSDNTDVPSGALGFPSE